MRMQEKRYYQSRNLLSRCDLTQLFGTRYLADYSEFIFERHVLVLSSEPEKLKLLPNLLAL